MRALERRGSPKIKRGEGEDERSHIIASPMKEFIWKLIKERENVTVGSTLNVTQSDTPINEWGLHSPLIDEADDGSSADIVQVLHSWS